MVNKTVPEPPDPNCMCMKCQLERHVALLRAMRGTTK